MSIRGIADRLFSGHRVILMVILCLFGLCVMQSAGQKGKRFRQQKAKVEDKRVYLIHADQLRKAESAVEKERHDAVIAQRIV